MNTIKVTALASAFSLLSLTVSAEQAVNQEALKRYCTGDYLEHCGEYTPGGPEVEMCFRRKVKVLSPNCSAAISAYQRSPTAIRRVSTSR